MHDGCSGQMQSGMEMLQKIRMMGFNQRPTPVAHKFVCECEAEVEMTTLEYKCESCGMVYAVTPCSAMDITMIKPAGKNV